MGFKILTPEEVRVMNAENWDWIFEQVNNHLSKGETVFSIVKKDENHIKKHHVDVVTRYMKEAGWIATVDYKCEDRPCSEPYLEMNVSPADSKPLFG